MDCRRRIGTGSHCGANSCSNNRHKCPRNCTNDCTYSHCFFCNLQFKWPNDFTHFSTLLTCFLTPFLRTNCVYSIIPYYVYNALLIYKLSLNDIFTLPIFYISNISLWQTFSVVTLMLNKSIWYLIFYFILMDLFLIQIHIRPGICYYYYNSWLPGFTRAPPSRPPLLFSLPSAPPFLPPSLPPSPPPSLQSAPPSFHLWITRLRSLPGFAQNICIIVQDNCIPEILFKTCFTLL